MASIESERPRGNGPKVLGYADHILKDNNAELAVAVCIDAMRLQYTHQFALANKARDVAFKARDFGLIDNVMEACFECKEDEMPGYFVAELAMILADQKLAAGTPIDREIEIIKKYCLKESTIAFIRAKYDKNYTPPPSYRTSASKSYSVIAEESVFAPRAPIKLREPVEFLIDRQYRRPELRLYKITDGSIFYNGAEFLVIDAAGDILDISAHSEYTVGMYRKALARQDQHIHVGDAFVAFGMSSAANYSHWVADWLPRILLYHKAIKGRLDVAQFHRPTRFEAQFMELNPEYNRVDCFGKKILHAKNLYILSSSKVMLHPAYMGHQSYVQVLRDAYCGRFPDQHGYRKIYVSRRLSDRRRLLVEEQLEAALEKIGFHIVIPETLSVPDQIRIFEHAEIIVGTHGAGLTNSLFSSGCKALVEIFPPEYGIHTYQIIADCIGADYYYYSERKQDASMTHYNQFRDYKINVERVVAQISDICRKY